MNIRMSGVSTRDSCLMRYAQDIGNYKFLLPKIHIHTLSTFIISEEYCRSRWFSAICIEHFSSLHKHECLILAWMIKYIHNHHHLLWETWWKYYTLGFKKNCFDVIWHSRDECWKRLVTNKSHITYKAKLTYLKWRKWIKWVQAHMPCI